MSQAASVSYYNFFMIPLLSCDAQKQRLLPLGWHCWYFSNIITDIQEGESPANKGHQGRWGPGGGAKLVALLLVTTRGSSKQGASVSLLFCAPSPGSDFFCKVSLWLSGETECYHFMTTRLLEF